ncbi:unnamed protein product, partial [Mesorhabditis spiculigera]
MFEWSMKSSSYAATILPALIHSVQETVYFWFSICVGYIAEQANGRQTARNSRLTRHFPNLDTSRHKYSRIIDIGRSDIGRCLERDNERTTS